MGANMPLPCVLAIDAFPNKCGKLGGKQNITVSGGRNRRAVGSNSEISPYDERVDNRGISRTAVTGHRTLVHQKRDQEEETQKNNGAAAPPTTK